MPANKNQKIQNQVPQRQRDDYPVDLITRAARVSTDSTINEEARTVEADIVTSSPVMVLDRSRWEYVDEILDMDGMEMPGSRQVPLLNNHSRWNITDVVGSVREISQKEGIARGTLNFSSLAEDAWTLVKERHLTDVSAGYRIFEDSSIYIERGCDAIIKGKKVKNKGTRTLAYRTRWKLQEVSITPIGADEKTKMRNDSADAEFNIDENRQSQSHGGNMPEEIKKNTETNETRSDITPAENQKKIEEESKRKAHELVERSKAMIENVEARGKLLQLTDEEIREAKKDLSFIEEGDEKRCLDKMFDIQKRKLEKNNIQPGTIEGARVTNDAIDNFRKIAALSIYRTGGGKLTEEERKGVDASIYPQLTILGCMRAWLEINGVRGAGSMAPTQVYFACADLRKRSFAITNGDLANVFLDVANKDMAKGYTETATVHEILCGRDTNINFQPKYTIDVSALGDPEELKTGESFPFTSMSDSKESVQLNMYGLAVNLDFRAIINDTLGALVGMPARLGQSMRRKEELLFWIFLYGTNMAGPTMGEDNTAMFTTGHRNFVARGATGAGAPTTTTLKAGKKAMKKQIKLAPDGRAETQYTSLIPKFLIVHGDIIDDVTQRVLAIYDIDATTNSNARENVPQLPWVRALQPVSAPYLDARMDAATNPHYGWYLMADPNVTPTINKVLLAGMETPTLRQKNSDVAEPLGTIYDIYHSVAFGQVNYRPVYANYGADQS